MTASHGDVVSQPNACVSICAVAYANQVRSKKKSCPSTLSRATPYFPNVTLGQSAVASFFFFHAAIVMEISGAHTCSPQQRVGPRDSL